MRRISIAVLLCAAACAAAPAFAQSTGTANGTIVSTTSGSGWIPVSAGAKGSFEILGRQKGDGTFSGRVLYSDNKLNFTLEGKMLSGFTPGCKTTLQGSASSNLGPVQFVVVAVDSGNDASQDTFSIALTGATSYSASGKLGGGRIDAHQSCP